MREDAGMSPDALRHARQPGRNYRNALLPVAQGVNDGMRAKLVTGREEGRPHIVKENRPSSWNLDLFQEVRQRAVRHPVGIEGKADHARRLRGFFRMNATRWP